MPGKVKGFFGQQNRMKAERQHFARGNILDVHCVLHRQHLAAKRICGNMREALDAEIHSINFVKANPVNDRLFSKFCKDVTFEAFLIQTQVKWLSKCLSFQRLVNLCKLQQKIPQRL